LTQASQHRVLTTREHRMGNVSTFFAKPFAYLSALPGRESPKGGRLALRRSEGPVVASNGRVGTAART
jgi:hypothetical protein